ncbi:hypothetical protein, partial [Salmonella enterica]|uniref:hypothetical protein n=1 Tax=Salmonella enterica TaxID=28901 RepID=UPI00293B2455
EWVHVQLHQQKGMISLSPPTICNSAAKVLWPVAGATSRNQESLRLKVHQQQHWLWDGHVQARPD